MNQDKDMLDKLKKAGVPEAWYILSEVFQDSAFDQILTTQERNILRDVKGNILSVKNYEQYIVNIVSKYYAWQLHRDTKLATLKNTVRDVQSKIEDSQKDLEALTKFSQVAQGATALTAYAEIFKTRSDDHAKKAKINMFIYFGALLILLAVIGFVFFVNVAEFNFFRKIVSDDIQMTKFSIGIYALKVVVLLFFFQVAQFFRKNYNAEKHLEQVNLHRSDVMQSLHAVYVAIEDKNEKDKVLSTGALFAFERGETGYISTKEGAGSGDSSIESVLSRILK